MPRSYVWNGFETTLVATMSVGQQTAQLTTTTGLQAPCYLLLDADIPAKHEWIRVNAINGTTIENIVRNQAGSVGDIEHTAGAVVRGVLAHQVIDSIFTDIEGNASNISSVSSSLSTHTGGTDQHPEYLRDAEHSLAIHTALGLVTSGDVFPTGTRMVFDQNSAPGGWTRDTSTANDRVIRIVTGTRSDGGTWTQPGHVHQGPSHTHSGPSHNHSVNSHTHSGPSHTHSFSDTSSSHTGHTHDSASHSHGLANSHTHSVGGVTSSTTGTAFGQEGTGSSFEYVVKSHIHNFIDTADNPTTGTTQVSGIIPTSSGGSHSHTVSGTTGSGGTGNTGSASPGTSNSGTGQTSSAGSGNTSSAATASSWRPLHRDMIIAVKS